MKEKGETIIPEELYHVTEQHVETYRVDYEINNTGTLPELYGQVEAMLWVIQQQRGGITWAE
jgi:hypothetical protein